MGALVLLLRLPLTCPSSTSKMTRWLYAE